MLPDQFTQDEKMIDVGDGHQLYAQLWGAADAAKTFVFLHGGPGGGTSDSHKSLFDPTRHNVVFFDQRGAGKSLPYGSLKANDTDHLVQDINTVTDSFGINRFTLVGGSWGSCLALAYGIRHPKKVERMILQGLFTGRASEVDRHDSGEIRTFYPDAWEQFVGTVPEEFQDSPQSYHAPRILGDDMEAAKQSAYAYSSLVLNLLTLDDRPRKTAYEDFDPLPTIIESHYNFNGCFMPDNYVMDNAAKLTMPIDLVQGRYDAVCPPVTAYELSQKLPDARLHWTVAGHSGYDRANWDLTKTLIAHS